MQSKEAKLSNYVTNIGITHFYECLLPTSICNLKCEYCYLIQENRRGMKKIPFKYSIEHMCYALRRERVTPNGGLAFFSICGTGETLLQDGCVTLIHGLLEQGHIVNITTNGTISKKFDDLLNFDNKYLKNMQIAFSLHYLELKRLNLLDQFCENVKKTKEAGCSIIVQINLYDGYLPYLEEIRKICIEQFGAPPQVAATRLEPNGNDIIGVQLYTNLSKENYMRAVDKFDSPLFNFTMQNFGVKRKEFCYAGDWSFSLHLEDGCLSSCYQSYHKQNIFEDPDTPIVFSAIGHSCKSAYCINSSHYISLGNIPEIKCPSYCELRDRPEAKWYTPELKSILSRKLYENNEEYNQKEKKIAEIRYREEQLIYYGKKIIRKFNKNI